MSCMCFERLTQMNCWHQQCLEYLSDVRIGCLFPLLTLTTHCVLIAECGLISDLLYAH